MTGPAETGPLADVAEKDRIIGLLADEWAMIGDLLAGLPDPAWEVPVLPGWDVHDTLAHLIGTERMLAGEATPELPAGEEAGEHVRNDIGRFNEAWVVVLRQRSHADLLADFRAVAAQRQRALRAMPAEDFVASSWTPAGQATYDRFMKIRIFDCWMHEQDIRVAVGQPGNEDGPAARESLDEVVRGLGYIVGKRGRAPQGSSVLIRLTGPIERDLSVVVDGRAKVADSIDGEPTAALTLSSSLFLRLTGGRPDARDALGGVGLDGDKALARQVAENLAFTI